MFTASRKPRTLMLVGSGLGFVANHFDVVPVRTDDERCVVLPLVLRAQARCTIVFATRLERCTIERFDLLAILGLERNVEMRRLLFGLEQAQGSVGPWRRQLDTVGRGPLSEHNDAERFECLEEERLASCVVADSKFDVVKHELFHCSLSAAL